MHGTSAGLSLTILRAWGGARRPARAESPSVGRFLLKILYWLAVLAISLALVVALILFLESRDESSLDEEASAPLVVSSM